MLISFSVENFRSFMEMQTITLEASRDKAAPHNVIIDAQGAGIDLLRGAAIYGPNASGKSNLFKAMSFMRHYVLYSANDKSKQSDTGTVPFKLREDYLEIPSKFEVEFIHSGIHYLYGFSLDLHSVTNEWLYSYPEKRRRILFSRSLVKNDDGSDSHDYYWGPSWTGEKAKLVEVTRPDVLFISTASQFNHKIASTITEWFSDYVQVIEGQSPDIIQRKQTISLCENEVIAKRLILKIMRNADLAINNLEIHKHKLNDIFLRSKIPQEFTDNLLQAFEIDPEKAETEGPVFYRTGYRTSGEEYSVLFEDREESDGTMKFFGLLGPLLHALANGCCLYIDELDNHLHPHLTRAIVDLFLNPESNTEGAQIVFATHDTNLLGEHDLFRRDQIWLTQKDDTGATTLRSLWDYRIRKNENIEKGYLSGRYSGVPFIEGLIDHADKENNG